MKGYEKLKKEHAEFVGLTDGELLDVLFEDKDCPRHFGLKDSEHCVEQTCVDCCKSALEADYSEEEGE